MYLKDQIIAPTQDMVSRRRYLRERRAREEAETLLEDKSRELFEANQRLQRILGTLEVAVKERTQELEDARLAAETANEAKSVFLASMSHEIRTPLNGILGMAQALDDSGLSTDQSQLVGILRDSGKLLLSIINDVLDLSKIEAGKLDFEFISYNLPDLASQLRGHYQFPAEEKGLDFRLTMSEAAKRRVHTDPTRVQQVAGNLLSNAIKFTQKGSVSLEIDIAPTSDVQGVLTLKVTDTGPGIPKAQQGRLFQRFQQANSSVVRMHGGTGLGLAISRNICELMGGGLSLTSSVGKGAEFVATIQVDLPQEKAPLRRSVTKRDAKSRLRGLQVLAAEDNKTNRIVLQHMLKNLGLTLHVVDSGAAAVKAWEEAPFDIVLMDINMPNMDGLEATRRIRERERAQMRDPIPILAVSANAMVHQVANYLSEGMSGHVSKPISRTGLVQAMANALDEAARWPG